MPPFSGPNAIADGTIVTAMLADNAVTIAKFQNARARVFMSAVQNIPNAANTVLNFDSESYDTASIHDVAVNNSRLTVPAGYSGYAKLAAQALWTNSTGARLLLLRKNGGTIVLEDTSGIGLNYHSIVSGLIPVVAGDYFEILARQDSGAAQNINSGTNGTFFEIALLG